MAESRRAPGRGCEDPARGFRPNLGSGLPRSVGIHPQPTRAMHARTHRFPPRTRRDGPVPRRAQRNPARRGWGLGRKGLDALRTSVGGAENETPEEPRASMARAMACRLLMARRTIRNG